MKASSTAHPVNRGGAVPAEVTEVTQTTSDSQHDQRHRLLGVLFGSEVPSALDGQLLRTSDVATLFQVSERTVSEWAKRGQIPCVRTPGGHRRYPADEIRALLDRDGRSVGGQRI